MLFVFLVVSCLWGYMHWKDLQLVSVLQIGYNFGAVGKAAFAGIGENGAVFLKLPEKISSYEVIL